MLTQVIAPQGCKKTEYILGKISDAISRRKKVYVIVPEQIASEYEKMIVLKFGNESNEYCEVTNFSRLSNVVLRTYGLLARNYLSESEKKLCYFFSAVGIKDALEYIKSVPDRAGIEMIMSEIEELKNEGADAKKLFALSENEELPPMLRKKLFDLASLSAAFGTRIANIYDDDTDEMTFLSKVLDDYEFFKGSEVFIDSFWDFTYPENLLIGKIARQCDDIHITFCFDGKKTVLFKKAMKARKMINAIMAKENIPVKEVYLESTPENEISDIRFMSENLLNHRAKKRKSSDSIKIFACRNPYDEAKFCATRIIEEVHLGKKWSDFAILSRSGENARIFSLVLKKYGIPSFYDDTESVLDSPIAKTVLIALKIACGTELPGDCVRLVSDGILPVSENDAFALLKYMKVWKLTSRELMFPTEFDMHPNGLVEWRPDGDEESRKELERVNFAKEKVFMPLRKLSFAMTESDCEEKTLSLIAFLKEIEIEKRVRERVEEYKAGGKYDLAAREIRFWNLVIEALGDILRISPKEKTETALYPEIVEIAFSGKKSGSVPPVQDAVLIGKAGFSRADGKKTVFMTGMNSSSFPKPDSGDKFISLTEREKLCDEELQLNCGEDERINEYFLFYLGCMTATERLFISFSVGKESDITDPKSSVSVIISRIKMLFDEMPISVFDPKKEMPMTKEQLFEYVCDNARRSDSTLEKLKGILSGDDEYKVRLLDAVSGKAYKDILPRLRTEKPYAGKNVQMSYSKLETYARCKYEFFAKSLLGLKPLGKSDIEADFAGTFVHEVMEKVLLRLTENGEDIAYVSDERLSELNHTATSDFYLSIKGLNGSAKTKKLVGNFEKSTLLLLKNIREEFRHTEFVPILFEKDLSTLESEYRIGLSDGTFISFSGKIDRVDYLEKENLVRIVDYKTGTQKFELYKVSHNIGVQMLIYLFALCKGRFEYNGRVISPKPGGIVYVTGTRKIMKAQSAEELEKTEAAAEKPFIYDGLYLDKEELLPEQEKKKRTKNMISAERFIKLEEIVEDNFKKLIEELKDGNIDPCAVFDSRNSSEIKSECGYCQYKAVCKRFEKNLVDITEFDEAKFWGEEGNDDAEVDSRTKCGDK